MLPLQPALSPVMVYPDYVLGLGEEAQVWQRLLPSLLVEQAVVIQHCAPRPS